jgi:hypothetical protein
MLPLGNFRTIRAAFARELPERLSHLNRAGSGPYLCLWRLKMPFAL